MENKVNLEKIRKMSDEDLKKYIDYLQNKAGQVCSKCYSTDVKYFVYIKQNNQFPSMRKACAICENCYNELMDYLEVKPIEW